jgi:hypothetical protein
MHENNSTTGVRHIVRSTSTTTGERTAVGIYPLKGGRHEDACPMVDLLLKKGRWRSNGSSCRPSGKMSSRADDP